MDRLLQEVTVIDTRGDAAGAEITSIALDHRRVGPGALFACLPGRHADGHEFAGAAVAAGAGALLVEHTLPLAVPQVVVAPGTARAALARMACALYGHPARALVTVGVTGTNGKTTVTHLVRAILTSARWPCAVIGTLDGARTTPEAPDLQRRLDGERRRGIQAVAMEVSSHALDQARVDGFRFTVAAFTNLSHDHLDYHGTMEAYFAAKAQLFTPEHAVAGVVNVGDAWGRRLADQATVPVSTVSMADAGLVTARQGSTTFTWRGRDVTLRLSGRYHVVNALVAAAIAERLGVGDEAVVAGLCSARPVPGRFEVVETGAPFTVVVDYAHTPDALSAALGSARELAGGRRVLVVFGCGGDRDRAKRPAMGAVAAADADLAVVTSDNSRSEDPARIIDQVLAGISDPGNVRVEPERRAAIAAAVAAARPGDVVVVAGKGHETTLRAGDAVVEFDDRVVVADVVAAEMAARGGGPG